jgi:hypothetical protein
VVCPLLANSGHRQQSTEEPRVRFGSKADIRSANGMSALRRIADIRST